MTGLVGSSIRRIAGCFGVLAVVGLIAVPVALANGDTITATATVQFSGVVDSFQHRARPASATIDWGDGTADTTGTITRQHVAISGTHTYASSADGTVHRHGHASPAATARRRRLPDNFTANVGLAPPMFTQCPRGRFATPAASS